MIDLKQASRRAIRLAVRHKNRLQFLALAGAFGVTSSVYAADTVDLMHDALKERWYTTEVIVFRNTRATDSEATVLEGKMRSVAEEALSLDSALADSDGDTGSTDEAINVLTLGQASNAAGDRDNGDDGDDPLAAQRPELEAEPWESIKDYDAVDDLGELVARNMATWETQLRARDGQWLPDEELTLVDAAERLQKSRHIEVLMHKGWIQSVPPRSNPRPIPVDANESNSGAIDSRDSFADNAFADNAFAGTQTVPAGAIQQANQLSGSFSVTLGRYLHIHPTLFLTKARVDAANGLEGVQTTDASTAIAQARAAAAAARGETNPAPEIATSTRTPEVRDLSSTTNTQRGSALDRLREAKSEIPEETEGPTEFDTLPFIRLDESRRLRSGEIHYLDHPELGVLVRITPVVADQRLQEQFALLQ